MDTSEIAINVKLHVQPLMNDSVDFYFSTMSKIRTFLLPIS